MRLALLVLLGNLHVHVLDAAFKFRLSDASFVARPPCMHDNIERCTTSDNGTRLINCTCVSWSKTLHLRVLMPFSSPLY